MFTQVKYYIKKAIRQSFTFNKILKELHASQYFTEEQLEELQNKKLRKIIKHCYKNVPYYRELFDMLNLKPKDIMTKEDLKKLPFMDKQTIRDNFDKLIAKNKIKLFLASAKTSGTTGFSINLYRDYYLVNFENAILNRFWINAGDNNQKRITLRGHIIVPINQISPPFWEYNKADNELIMSTYHLSQKNAKIYINKIIEFNPRIIYAQPSSIFLLAKFFESINHNLKIQAVFTSSEDLSISQRNLVEKVFKCKIYDEYGLAERVAAIHQCEKGTYHIQEDYSIVELLDNFDGTYEICGTHLYNYAMPLLRYKTGDFVEPQQNQCNCGRSFREIKNIKGRSIYYILSPENNKILNVEVIHSEIDNIIEAQYVQETQNKLVINVVTKNSFCDKDREKLIQNALNQISQNIEVHINPVEAIQRASTGKFITVVKKFETEENYFGGQDEK